MKDFMFIFRNIPGAQPMSPEEMQAQMQLWMNWVEKLKTQDLWAGGERLAPGGKTVSGKKALVTDGPFAESKEVLGGFFIVKAASIEEASLLAKDCPDLPLGGAVEVREIMKM